ncbi:MAG: DUF47 domain-containing protein [Janthinobacterium lividum]
MPKEDRFFGLFDRHAATLVEGARALTGLLEGGDAVPRCAASIVRAEEAADEITREALNAVRRTFITPFDRSDIQDLVTTLDDTIDQMQKTAKRRSSSRCPTSKRPCARWARSFSKPPLSPTKPCLCCGPSVTMPRGSTR